MANILKTFLKALLEKNYSDDKEIEQATQLGEMVASKAENNIGIRSKVYVDAEKARKVADEKAKKNRTTRETEKIK